MVCQPWEIDSLLALSMGMRFMTSMMELQSSDFLGTPGEEGVYSPIQLFQEKLSEKVHATIPKGIVGGLKFTVLRRNLQEWHERPWTYVCVCERKATKVSSTATVSGTVYRSYPILPFGIVVCTFFPTTFLEIAVYT